MCVASDMWSQTVSYKPVQVASSYTRIQSNSDSAAPTRKRVSRFERRKKCSKDMPTQGAVAEN